MCYSSSATAMVSLHTLQDAFAKTDASWTGPNISGYTAPITVQNHSTVSRSRNSVMCLFRLKADTIVEMQATLEEASQYRERWLQAEHDVRSLEAQVRTT
jgi:hypothetical protein